MDTKYINFVKQNFDFPQIEFTLNSKNELQFHKTDLMKLVKEYGTPLRFTYLPKISDNVKRVKKWFAMAIEKNNYQGDYRYCYCTKSSHFKHVMHEALKNDIHIETSSAFDINIVQELKKTGKIKHDSFIICNGFKRAQYIDNIAMLINGGHENCIPIIDNYKELELLSDKINKHFTIGIRIASEEEPNFEFYTSRLGIGYKDILGFYKSQIKKKLQVFFKDVAFLYQYGYKGQCALLERTEQVPERICRT